MFHPLQFKSHQVKVQSSPFSVVHIIIGPIIIVIIVARKSGSGWKNKKTQIRGGNVYYHVHGYSHKIKQNDKCVSVSRTLCGVTSQGHLFLRFFRSNWITCLPNQWVKISTGWQEIEVDTCKFIPPHLNTQNIKGAILFCMIK